MADTKKKTSAKTATTKTTKAADTTSKKTTSTTKVNPLTNKLDSTLKTPNQKRLGKGLDALIGNKIPELEREEKADVSRETSRININLIDPNPDQPRKVFDEDALQELATSIKEHDLIQPIVVQKSGDRYIIVAGERRWRASRLAGLKDVPVFIRDFTKRELFEAALIENIQRQDLNAIEEAEAYNVLINEFNLKQDEVAEHVGKSRVAVTNSVRLLNLDKRVRQLVVDDMISGGHARALLAIKDDDLQYKIAMQVFDQRLSVRETEKLIKKLVDGDKTKTTKAKNDKLIDEVIIHDIEEKLKTAIGSKVTINQKPGHKGSIVIDYYSSDELDRLYDLLRNSGR